MDGTAQPHNDPLLDFEFKDEDGATYRVTGYWDINRAYVLVHDGYQEHIRPTAVIARRKELDEA